jgi:hypothetical protein
MRKVGEEPMKRFIAQIASRAREQKLSRKDLADQILHFVQREIKYEHDIDTTGFEEYGRFPLQTLYDGHGDCECAAILALAILLYLGYDCAMLVFEFKVGGTGHVDPGLLVDPLEIDEWGIERREDLFFEPASRRHYLYGCAANDAFEGSPWGPKIERFNSLKIATTTIIPLSAKRWRVFDWEDEPEKTNTDDSSEE